MHLSIPSCAPSYLYVRPRLLADSKQRQTSSQNYPAKSRLSYQGCPSILDINLLLAAYAYRPSHLAITHWYPDQGPKRTIVPLLDGLRERYF